MNNVKQRWTTHSFVEAGRYHAPLQYLPTHSCSMDKKRQVPTAYQDEPKNSQVEPFRARRLSRSGYHTSAKKRGRGRGRGQFGSYAARNANVKAIGFDSYKKYLESKLWSSIRYRVLCRDRFKCRRCGKKANQVHHKEYTKDVLNGLNLVPLVSICAGCHKYIEFGADGEKVSTDVANRRFKDVVSESGLPQPAESVAQAKDNPSSPTESRNPRKQIKARMRRMNRERYISIWIDKKARIKAAMAISSIPNTERHCPKETKPRFAHEE